MFAPNTGIFAEIKDTIVVSIELPVASQIPSLLEPVTDVQQAALLMSAVTTQGISGANIQLHSDPHDVVAIHSGGGMYVLETVADEHAVSYSDASLELVGVPGILETSHIWLVK